MATSHPASDLNNAEFSVRKAVQFGRLAAENKSLFAIIGVLSVALALLGFEVIENTRALPRAYVVPRAQAFSPARHPGLTATQLVASPDVDLHSMLLVENDPNAAAEPSGTLPLAPAIAEDQGPNVVRVTATAEQPSYVVLNDFYQRGWTAQVDGQPARVVIANALFRAVAIEPGAHAIEFRFEPQSVLIGGVVSAISLVVVLASILIGYALSRK